MEHCFHIHYLPHVDYKEDAYTSRRNILLSFTKQLQFRSFEFSRNVGIFLFIKDCPITSWLYFSGEIIPFVVHWNTIFENLLPAGHSFSHFSFLGFSCMRHLVPNFNQPFYSQNIFISSFSRQKLTHFITKAYTF